MSNFNENSNSRFVRKNDLNSDECIFHIPSVWWSRRYEYPWAMKFAEQNDVCLDAACGVEHHFKFFLAQNCSKVYCLDLDERLKNPVDVLSLASKHCDIDKYTEIINNMNKIQFDLGKISEMKYEDKFFDKIYCISVLEHLDNNTLENSLSEFERVLKDDGLIVLTFDYPSVNLELISQLIYKSNLRFADELDLNIPSDCLVSEVYPGLMCFRAVLCKK